MLITVYDVSGAASDRNVVVLNDIHIDIMDYIVPASCTDTEFRQMWAEFEWENKVRKSKGISEDLWNYWVQLLIRLTLLASLIVFYSSSFVLKINILGARVWRFLFSFWSASFAVLEAVIFVYLQIL